MNLNKRSFILAATLVFSTGVAFSQSAPAAPQAQEQTEERHHRAGKRAGGAKHFAAALNLTDAQKEQAKAIRERHRASTKTLRTEMRNLHQQYRAAKEANNTAELERLSQQRQSLGAQVKEAMTAQQNEFRSILNPEQQAKFDELVAKRAERFKERGFGKHGKRD
jgi:Spy/CpxP family protein refolding chaperone